MDISQANAGCQKAISGICFDETYTKHQTEVDIVIFNLVRKEITHRKFNFSLAVLAVIMAVAFFVAFFTAGEASRRETRRIMRDMGQNLRIIPRQTEMDRFWIKGYSDYTIPEEYAFRFAKYRGFSYTHLTATLQKEVTWNDKQIILTGILPEILPPDKLQQKPMVFSVQPNTVYVGYELAHSLNIKEGDTLDLFGREFKVIKCLSQTGSNDDIRIYGHLHDIQEILNMKGQINEIKALECLCILEASNGQIDPLELAQQQLKQIMPEAKVILLRGIAEIRQKQRAMMEKYISYIMPFLLIVSALWIGVLAMLNVRDRKQEIGMLRAIGYGSGKIALMFVEKAVLLGILGAIVGFVIGTGLSLKYGPEIFKVTAKAIKPDYGLLGWSLLIAPLFSVIASFIPTIFAAVQDPAETLREE